MTIESQIFVWAFGSLCAALLLGSAARRRKQQLTESLRAFVKTQIDRPE